MLVYIRECHAGINLKGCYIQNSKNAMAAEFYNLNGFRVVEDLDNRKIYEYAERRQGYVVLKIVEALQ